MGRSGGDRAVAGSADLAAYLLDEGRVATIPGAAFGADANLRLSFALSEEKIRDGLDRISSTLSRLT